MASAEELAAADPGTALAELARLAHEHPELRVAIAGNPSTYDALLDWLGQLGDPQVDAVLARRRAVDGPPAAPVAAAPRPHSAYLTAVAPHVDQDAMDARQAARQPAAPAYTPPAPAQPAYGVVAHPGYAPQQVVYAQPVVYSQPGARTNTMAILAIVFGIGGGLLGIVFGHMARAQIRRTGEGGWGIATVGLVFGYLGLLFWVGVIIFYIWLFATAASVSSYY